MIFVALWEAFWTWVLRLAEGYSQPPGPHR